MLSLTGTCSCFLMTLWAKPRRPCRSVWRPVGAVGEMSPMPSRRTTRSSSQKKRPSLSVGQPAKSLSVRMPAS